MKKTFYVGEDKKHKIDVDFGLFGREQIYVDGVSVHDKISFTLKGKREFKAGDRHILIDMSMNLKEWSCKVFVDDSLYIAELFEEELMKHKSRLRGSRKFYKYLFIACTIVLIISFLRGFFRGMAG